MKKIIEVAGWYGMAAILLAYVLVSFSLISTTNIWYPILNGTGAIGIMADSFYKKDYQPGILNLIWAGVAIIAVFRIFF